MRKFIKVLPIAVVILLASCTMSNTDKTKCDPNDSTCIKQCVVDKVDTCKTDTVSLEKIKKDTKLNK